MRDVLDGGIGQAHAAMKSCQQAGFRQALQVAPDSLYGNAQMYGKRVDRAAVVLVHMLQQLDLAGIRIHFLVSYATKRMYIETKGTDPRVFSKGNMARTEQ